MQLHFQAMIRYRLRWGTGALRRKPMPPPLQPSLIAADADKKALDKLTCSKVAFDDSSKLAETAVVFMIILLT